MRAMRPAEALPASEWEVSDASLIPIAEVGGLELIHHEDIDEWARRVGVTVYVDWRGQPGVLPSDAYRLRVELERVQAEHQRKWQAYQADLADRKRKAREAQQEAARKARQEATVSIGKQLGAARGWEADRVAREAALAEEARQRRVGNPVPFEKFKAPAEAGQ